ncbi:MAG: hypothetical protein JJT78_03430 [Leptospira sp.]|nr:hypothetical protein [Leptospira sp.]
MNEEEKNSKDNLQERLYLLQSKASEMEKSCYVILEGWAQTGKGRILKTSTYRMDPKKLKVYSPVDTEMWDSKYPFQYKYWYHFPPKGTTFFLLKSWYYRVSFGIQNKDIKKEDVSKAQKSILNLEKTLADDGILIIKFFLDITKEELSKRLKKAEKEGKTWEVTKEDKRQVKDYDDYTRYFQDYRNLTDQPYAPWHVLSAMDSNKTEMEVMKILVSFLEKKLGVDSWDMMKQLVNGDIE